MIAIPALEKILSRPATWDDIPEIVEFNNRVLVEKTGKIDWTIEDTHEEFSEPGFVIEDLVRIWHDRDNQIVATGIVLSHQVPPVRPGVLVYVMPGASYHDTLGTEVLAWAESVARLAIPRCLPEAKVQMIAWTNALYEPLAALFRSYGMSRIRGFRTMKIELPHDVPAPDLPEGVTIRTIRYPEESRELYRVTDDAFADHYGHVPDPQGDGYERWEHQTFKHRSFDPSLWFVAEVDEEIAGFAWCMKGIPEDPELAWISTLGVLPAFRRRGIATLLLRHAFSVFRSRGMHGAGLGVDATNITGANRVYERVGMKATDQWDTYAKVLRDGVELARE